MLKFDSIGIIAYTVFLCLDDSKGYKNMMNRAANRQNNEAPYCCLCEELAKLAKKTAKKVQEVWNELYKPLYLERIC